MTSRDCCYRALEEEVVGIISLQAPVASDLRLLIAILHAGLHVERIGDTAAYIAEVVAATSHLPCDPRLLLRLEQMGQMTLDVIDAAMAGFTARDLHGCEQLAVLDDRVDALHAGMIEVLIRRGADPDLLPSPVHVAGVETSRTGGRPCGRHRRAGLLPHDRRGARLQRPFETATGPS